MAVKVINLVGETRNGCLAADLHMCLDISAGSWQVSIDSCVGYLKKKTEPFFLGISTSLVKTYHNYTRCEAVLESIVSGGDLGEKKSFVQNLQHKWYFVTNPTEEFEVHFSNLETSKAVDVFCILILAFQKLPQ